jgi:hypothetical protein
LMLVGDWDTSGIPTEAIFALDELRSGEHRDDDRDSDQGGHEQPNHQIEPVRLMIFHRIPSHGHPQ